MSKIRAAIDLASRRFKPIIAARDAQKRVWIDFLIPEAKGKTCKDCVLFDGRIYKDGNVICDCNKADQVPCGDFKFNFMENKNAGNTQNTVKNIKRTITTY
jgi:hypothetical protein